uniref:Uncharacterized protein n=1 Tax=Klebsiella pneumoniae subsp. pneumoniae TaxID=72407 RepID=A0A7T7GR52_KLEPN|nr:hypothetical protein [Klebsiella pneumoniae subsp. pneumoniae]
MWPQSHCRAVWQVNRLPYRAMPFRQLTSVSAVSFKINRAKRIDLVAVIDVSRSQAR